jgi:hypothetical protein
MANLKEYSIADYIGLPTFDNNSTNVNFTTIINDLEKLDKLLDKLSSVSIDELESLVDDIHYYRDSIEKSVEVLEEFQYADDVIESWSDELMGRLSDEERDDFGQTKLMRKLKGI